MCLYRTYYWILKTNDQTNRLRKGSWAMDYKPMGGKKALLSKYSNMKWSLLILCNIGDWKCGVHCFCCTNLLHNTWYMSKVLLYQTILNGLCCIFVTTGIAREVLLPRRNLTFDRKAAEIVLWYQNDRNWNLDIYQ